MPLTLEQYAQSLDDRDLTWPAAPTPQQPRARPHLVRLPEVRGIAWNLYGTLLCLSGGELFFEHPQKFIMDLALDKTVQEFKMWGAMSRKPGQPSEYMGQIYRNLLADLRLAPSPEEKFPEILVEKIWEGVLKKLLQKDYKYDANFYGSLNELSRKIAYFFHANLQGTACYPGAGRALEHVQSSGLAQGLLADAQCFSLVQLQRGLAAQNQVQPLDLLLPPALRTLSSQHSGRKPSERLFKAALQTFKGRGIDPGQILHVGSSMERDIIPARKLGMRTALFAGDKNSLQATPDQLKDPAARPDLLLTDLEQLTQVVG